ncbi:MAG: HypC/HybG/HupF family hydrogenase formation chaperone [Synergistaceae bacterium]|nr:HypC/HybG/HupF family hydrogenase formation chaperone [Synergistaceae bacterium]
MCLAVPYTITQINDDYTAKAVSGGVSVEVRLDLLEKPELGDTILVHAGFAIQKLESSEAEELFALWDEVNKISDVKPQ